MTRVLCALALCLILGGLVVGCKAKDGANGSNTAKSADGTAVDLHAETGKGAASTAPATDK